MAEDREWSWAEIEAAQANTRRPCTVPLDTEAVAQAQVLTERYVRLRDGEAGGLEDHSEEMALLKDQIRELIARAEAKQLTVVFQGVGRSRYNKLKAEHPAPEGQPVDELFKDAEYNVETFPPALMAAACVSPAALAGNVQGWTLIHDTWSLGPRARFWNTCLAAQQAVNSVPKLSAVSAVLGEISSDES